MEGIIHVAITTESFKKASMFTSSANCPLAVALNNLYPNSDISVGGYIVDIGPDIYRIPGASDSDYVFISDSYKGYDFDTIEEMIGEAKIGKEVETIYLTLTKY